jgi:hypothetical protein
MPKRIALFAATLLAAAALAPAEEWTHTYTVAGHPALHVDARDGSVTVRGGDQKNISATVTAIGWKIAPGELEVLDHQMGDRVEIALRVPSVNWSIGRRSVRVEIQVPRETQVDVRTGDGAIRVSDVSGEMRLTTGDGGIEATAVDGVLRARTGDGRISARGRFTALNLHTGDGSITAEVLPGSRLSSAWRIETGDGSVNLKVPADLAADLDLQTGDGSLSFDLPVTTTQHDKHSVKGKLNGGGPVFSVRTGDGSLRLH